MSKRRIVLLSVFAAAVLGAMLVVPRLVVLVQVGSGYTAKQMCSCRFVSERTPESCDQELEALAKALVRYDVTDDRVHAATLGLADATARYDEGFGCVLDDE